jgi:hypothetical protein
LREWGGPRARLQVWPVVKRPGWLASCKEVDLCVSVLRRRNWRGLRRGWGLTPLWFVPFPGGCQCPLLGCGYDFSEAQASGQ